MIELSLGFIMSAFFAGLLMFLAPCTLPLVPAFLASLVPHTDARVSNYTYRIFVKTLFFCIGFTTVFVGFGMVSGILGASITPYKILLSQIGGLLIIGFGVVLVAQSHVSFIERIAQKLQRYFHRGSSLHTPFIFGVIFALGWSPCSGPILASILILASKTGTALQGGVLLTIFSLGLAVPFILVALFFARTVSAFKLNYKYHSVMTYISGALLMSMGLVLLFGNMIVMTHIGFSIYSFFGYTPMCQFY